MRLKTILCVFLIAILTFGTAFAADVASIRQRAERGDVKAQVELGMMYHEGIDVKKDFKEAAKWWKMAADKMIRQHRVIWVHFTRSVKA